MTTLDLTKKWIHNMYFIHKTMWFNNQHMGFFQHILGLHHFKLGFQSGHVGIKKDFTINNGDSIKEPFGFNQQTLGVTHWRCWFNQDKTRDLTNRIGTQQSIMMIDVWFWIAKLDTITNISGIWGTKIVIQTTNRDWTNGTGNRTQVLGLWPVYLY